MEKASHDDATRPSLLVRLRDHADAEAWRSFALVYAPLIYGYCRKSGLQDADAADVAQEVLKQVSQSIRGFVYDQEKGRFRDWLRTVARHKVLRFLGCRGRGAHASAGIELLEGVAEPAADAEWTDDFHAHVLKVALTQIQPRFEENTWRAFERTWLSGVEAQQVATEVGLAIDQVYAAKSRVLKQLRAEVLMLAEDLPPFVPLDD
jgi:RNA polymerase sigma-70 factor (ECF subfamily)